MTEFFEPTENKEQWQELYKEISQIMFKGGKARHIMEYLYKAQNFLQPDVIKSVCEHEWVYRGYNYYKCAKCPESKTV